MKLFSVLCWRVGECGHVNIFKLCSVMDRAPSLSDEQVTLVEKRLLAVARDNRVICAAALTIAKSLGIPSEEVGRVADKLNIKISKCQLGCF